MGQADAEDVAEAAASAAGGAEGVGRAPAHRAGGGAAQGRRPVGRARRRDPRLERPRGRRDPADGRLRDARRGRGVLPGRGAAGPRRSARCSPASSRGSPWPGGCRPAWSASSRRSTSRSSSASGRWPRRSRSGNAVLLKPDPRTAVTGGTVMARIFEEAGLPAGVLQMLPGGKDVGEAMVTDPQRPRDLVHRLDSGRPVDRRAGRPAPQAGPPRAGRQLRAARSSTTRTSRRRSAWPRWASFLHQGQICMTTGRHFVARRGSTTTSSSGSPTKAGHLPVGDPATEQVALGPVIDERSAGQDPRPGHGERRRRARAWPRAGTYDRLFYRPTVLAEVPLDLARLHRGGLRPGRSGHPGLLGRGGGTAGRGERLRAVARHRHPRRDARPGARRADPDRHRAHQRPDRERRGERPLRRRRRLRAPAPGSAAPPRTSRRSPRPAGSRCEASRRPTRSERRVACPAGWRACS